MPRSPDYCLNLQKATPDAKNLEACQPGSVDTAGLKDLRTGTMDETKASNLRIFSPRQWYWFGLAILSLVFVAETVLTWRKWSNITGDLGTDLYVPWRLSQGAVLYRDVFLLAGGPFSQYLNALLFKIFGASFLTLAIFNLTATAVMLLALFRRFAAAADTGTATMICLATIVVFAFGYYFYEGFNYIMPYSNEALQGLILSVLAVGFLSDWISKGRLRGAILAGLCNGLVFLTKPDIFVALATCDVATVGLLFLLFRRSGFAVKSVAGFMAAGTVPPLFFLLYFLRVENLHESLRSVIFGWIPIFNGAVIKGSFYQWCTGLDRPWFHLRNIVLQFALVGAVTAFYAAAFRLIKTQKQDWTGIQRRAVPTCAPILLILIYAEHWRLSGEAFSASFVSMLVYLWILLAVGIFLLSTAASHWIPNLYRTPWAIMLMLIAPLLAVACAVDWVDCGYSLPLIALVSCILIYWNRQTLAEQQKFVFPLLWSVFGLMMLSKLGFFPRIWHYGFVLAMPAFASGIYCLFWLLPALLEKKWRVPALLFRSAVWLVFMVGIASLFRQSEHGYALQNTLVGAGNNRMLASAALEHANDFNAALDWIESNVPKDATIAILPQGAAINLLIGRINPTPCVFWDPYVVAVFGEGRMTSPYEASPPDYIVIVDRRVNYVDVPLFGSPGYGADLMQWIQQNYRTQILIGHEPLLKNGAFGIKILKYSHGPSITGPEITTLSHR